MAKYFLGMSYPEGLKPNEVRQTFPFGYLTDNGLRPEAPKQTRIGGERFYGCIVYSSQIKLENVAKKVEIRFSQELLIILLEGRTDA
jgi:hypothetical protein